MKRLTWLVLFSYTLFMVKPVMPVVMDVLAHTFWEQQHILIVHEVNGQFHVHNELVSASRQNEKDRQSGNSKMNVIDEYVTVGKPAVPISQEYFIAAGKVSYSSYQCYYPSSDFDLDAPPPKA